MTRLEIGKNMYFIVIGVSFIALFAVTYGIVEGRIHFKPDQNLKAISELLLSNSEFKAFKTHNGNLSLYVIRKDNIEYFNSLAYFKNFQLDETFVGKYLFIYNEGIGIYDLYKNRVIYINNDNKFELIMVNY